MKPHNWILAALLLVLVQAPALAQRGFFSEVRTLSLLVQPDDKFTPLNPFNVIGIPKNAFQFQLRPDLYYYNDRIEVFAKPRAIFTRAKIRTGPFFSEATNDTDTFLNEWRFRHNISDELTWSVGREVLEWGGGYFASPSNPFLGRNGRIRPQLEVPGLDFARLTWTPSTRWSVSAISNFDQGRLNVIGGHRDINALKVDWTGDRKQFGLIYSHRQGLENTISSYGVINVTNSILAHYEFSRADLAAPGASKTSWLAGGSYTFPKGGTAAIEYFHDGRRLISGGIDLLTLNSSVGSVAGPNVAQVGQNVDYVMMQYSDSVRARPLSWTLRFDKSLDNAGNRIVGLLSHEASASSEIFINAIVNSGGDQFGFGSLIRSVYLLGFRRTF